MTRVTALLLVLGVAAALAPRGDAESEPDYAAQAAACFATARAIAERDAGHLWGVRLDGPILLVDPSTRMAYADRADPGGVLVATDGVFVGRLPDGVVTANTATEWGGVLWTMVLLPLPDDPERRAALVAHELFHRAQRALGLPMASPPNAHLDGAEARYLLQLEWRALGRALASEGDERRRAVEDALAFRSRRRQRFPAAAAEERALELNEGLAEYTGCALGYATEAGRRAAATRAIESAAARPSLTRSFAYVSGPAYGLLLDESGAEWRRGLGAESDLGALLARAYRVTAPAEPERRIESRARRYGGAELLAAERRREGERRSRTAAWRARLVDGPTLEAPLGAEVQVSFDPNTVWPLGEAGTVYPTARVTDAWGVLAVSDGVLVSADWKRLELAAPGALAGRTLRGDGWTLELAEGWRVEPGARPGALRLVGPGAP